MPTLRLLLPAADVGWAFLPDHNDGLRDESEGKTTGENAHPTKGVPYGRVG